MFLCAVVVVNAQFAMFFSQYWLLDLFALVLQLQRRRDRVVPISAWFGFRFYQLSILQASFETLDQAKRISVVPTGLLVIGLSIPRGILRPSEKNMVSVPACEDDAL